jgi:hypothetical protein
MGRVGGAAAAEEPLRWCGRRDLGVDALRRRGQAETSLDLAAAALRTLELKRAAPDFTADEHYHPAALLCGETGPLLVALRLASDPALANDLHVLVSANVANPTDDVVPRGRPR